MKINKRLKNKILKICGSPEDFCYEYVAGSAGFEEGFRRMKEYVSAVNKVISSDKKKLDPTETVSCKRLNRCFKKSCLLCKGMYNYNKKI